MLSPLLYSLYTYDCTPVHSSNIFIIFASDTAFVGFISGDESAYRDEIKCLTIWCSVNHLSLNTTKIKEIITDFRRKCDIVPAP